MIGGERDASAWEQEQTLLPGISTPLLVICGAMVYGFLMGALAVGIIWWST